MSLLGLGALALATVPAACLYPDYTFNEAEPSGTSSSSGGGQGGGTGGQSSVTSSSSSSSSTGAGGMGGQGGTGGGMPKVEDCLNTIDDDGDGDTDCADADCQAYTCVANVPFGWSGFAALFEGVPAQEPACPSVFPSLTPYMGNNTLTTPAHTCSSCGCGAPTGQTCDMPDVITIQNKACGTTPTATGTLTVPATWTGSCYGPDGYPGATTCGGSPCNTSVTSAAPVVTGGSCMASGGTATLPPTSWAILGKACGEAPVGGGCGAGQVCQPKPEAPFLSGLCIYKGGDNTCPAGPFSAKHLFYEDVMDTRTCSTCQCGAPSGNTCDAMISIYSDQNANTCTTEVLTFAAGSCANITGNPPVIGRKATITAPTGGGCGVSGGGQPTGALAPANATTFCCVP